MKLSKYREITPDYVQEANPIQVGGEATPALSVGTAAEWFIVQRWNLGQEHFGKYDQVTHAVRPLTEAYEAKFGRHPL